MMVGPAGSGWHPARPAGGCAGSGGPVAVRHPLGDRQAQAGAGRARAGPAHEALEHRISQLRRKARPRSEIVTCQSLPARASRTSTCRARRPWRRALSSRFFSASRSIRLSPSTHACPAPAPFCGRYRRTSGRGSAWGTLSCRACGRISAVDAREVVGIAAVENTGVAQQLVDRARQPLGIAQHGLQAVPLFVAVVFLQRQLQLGAQCGQRRAQLVRGLGDEQVQGIQVLLQPRHEAVQRVHEITQFLGHRRRDGVQVGHRARRQFVLDAPDRRQRAVQSQ